MQTYPGSEDGAEPAYPIRSVDNALRLIRLFNERDTLRLTDACGYLGVAHSTAHRLLAMLVHHGFVQQDPQSRTYRPGPTLLESAWPSSRRRMCGPRPGRYWQPWSNSSTKPCT